MLEFFINVLSDDFLLKPLYVTKFTENGSTLHNIAICTRETFQCIVNYKLDKS